MLTRRGSCSLSGICSSGGWDRWSFFLLSFALMGCLLASCTSEKPSDQAGQGPAPQEAQVAAPASPAQAPMTAGPEVDGMSLSLTSEIYRNSTVYILPKGFAAADARIEWLVNGSPVTTPAPHLLVASGVNKGDKIQVRAVVRGKEVVSNTAEVKNSPPHLSGKINVLPKVFKPGDLLSVEPAAVDPDGDPVTFQYEWTKNGEPAGKTSRIETQVKRDDKVVVRITPCDADACGSPYILNAMVRNMPPQIEAGQKPAYAKNTYTLAVRAADPDGDPLTYSLKDGPEGMTIDPATGLMTWPVPDGFKGKGSFTISAKDPSGGEATQVFNFDLSR